MTFRTRRDGTRPLARAVAAVAALLALAEIARAEEPPPPAEGAKVTVTFEGGLVGLEMAKVIAGFGQESSVLPTRIIQPSTTVGLCNVLSAELSVPAVFCTKDLLDAMVDLNRQKGLAIDPDRITAAEGVYLPDVKTDESAIVRYYDQSRPNEAVQIEQRTNSAGWAPSILGIEKDILAKSGIADGAPQIDALTVKRFSWSFDVQGAEAGLTASYQALDLNSPNLSVSVEPFLGSKGEKPFFSYPADQHFRNWCESGAAPAPKPEGFYADMLSSLYETRDVAACDTGIRPEVAIMDQRITVNPDFQASFSDEVSAATSSPPVSTSCNRRQFNSETDHGNLLASIVAAGSNGYGFAGLAPDARIRPFEYRARAKNTGLLPFILETDTVSSTRVPRVFLFASELDLPYPFPEGSPSAAVVAKARKYWRWNETSNSFERLLAHEDVRLTGDIVREIITRKFLLVAAAGQPQADVGGAVPEGRELDWERPLSPQNLGDDDNVLVVAACVDCASPDASIWTGSNRGKPASNLVGVLAPGGSEMPAYVSADEVATTIGGTSSAAAFVAGLAARMAACHPKLYTDQPQNLKARIILASMPTADEKIRRSVVGGVVDPDVSMLDPDRDWLKLSTAYVRPVSFGHWCSKSVDIADDDIMELKKTHRLTAFDGGFIRQTAHDEFPENGRQVRRIVDRDIVRQIVPGDAPLAAVSNADGGKCVVLASRLTDLFLSWKSAEKSGVAACEELPPCE